VNTALEKRVLSESGVNGTTAVDGAEQEQGLEKGVNASK
jgi:hypothetical protein